MASGIPSSRRQICAIATVSAGGVELQVDLPGAIDEQPLRLGRPRLTRNRQGSHVPDGLAGDGECLPAGDERSSRRG